MSWLFSFLVSKCLAFLVSKFLGVLVLKFLRFKVSMSPYYQKSISCSLEDIDPIFTMFKERLCRRILTIFRCPSVPKLIKVRCPTFLETRRKKRNTNRKQTWYIDVPKFSDLQILIFTQLICNKDVPIIRLVFFNLLMIRTKYWV